MREIKFRRCVGVSNLQTGGGALPEQATSYDTAPPRVGHTEEIKLHHEQVNLGPAEGFLLLLGSAGVWPRVSGKRLF